MDAVARAAVQLPQKTIALWDHILVNEGLYLSPLYAPSFQVW
jgi:hypothetical protein